MTLPELRSNLSRWYVFRAATWMFWLFVISVSWYADASLQLDQEPNTRRQLLEEEAASIAGRYGYHPGSIVDFSSKSGRR